MTGTTPRLALTALICLLATPQARPTSAGEPLRPTSPAVEETPGLLATQVSLAVERGRVRRQFRATVISLKDDTMTVLTAAHCISDADKGGSALLLIGAEVVEGTVLEVVRNPSYRGETPSNGQTQTTRNPDGSTREEPVKAAPAPRATLGSSRAELPGPDNAVIQFRFKPTNKAAEDAFATIHPAPHLASRIYPGPGGQTVAVRIIDGHNVEHALKAGNHANPRWLQWGAAYKPIPGDSGGGVFLVQTDRDGQPQPILIGIIVGRDELGGGASLVAKDQRWIAEALAR